MRRKKENRVDNARINGTLYSVNFSEVFAPFGSVRTPEEFLFVNNSNMSMKIITLSKLTVLLAAEKCKFADNINRFDGKIKAATPLRNLLEELPRLTYAISSTRRNMQVLPNLNHTNFDVYR